MSGGARMRSRTSLISIAIAAACVAIAVMPAAGATGLDREVVGRRLLLTNEDPVMQPVNAPARIARVAVVPGSGGKEAWGIGLTTARMPGFDRVTQAGQVVFLHYRRTQGWQVAGAPLDESGRVINPQLAAIDVASDGTGYAVGDQGQIFKHVPGGPWRLDPSTGVTRNALFGVSIRRDRDGVHGYAVGASLTFLRLDRGRWTLDAANGSVGVPTGNVPDLAGVSTVSRTVAWAVSGSNSNVLWVMRRDANGWTRTLTGDPIFDSPPSPIAEGDGAGTVNQFARGNAVATQGSTVFISGMMQPIDPSRSTGDTSTPDRTRPFVLRWTASVTSYCPPQYQLSSSGVERTVPVCDQPFPLASGDLPALTAVGDAVFAGGTGMFRFDGRRWSREPSTLGYIVSASFSSPTEGWVATPGDVVGGAGMISASTATLGHWTRTPDATRLARWPHPDQRTLMAVANNGERTVAVGLGGAVVRLVGDAWDTVASPTTKALFSVAWASANRAFAVGSEGTIIRSTGDAWHRDPSAGRLTTRRLYGVAFAGADRGYAVGEAGTILSYNGRAWRVDPASGGVTTRNLSAIARVGNGFVAVGDKGTILQNTAGRWTRTATLDEDLKWGQEGDPSDLYSIAGSLDGHALIGGARSALVERAPNGRVRVSARRPLEGSIIALDWTPGRDQVVASVAPTGNRFSGDLPGAGSGWVFIGDATGWHDIQHGHATSASSGVDAPVLRDAVYGFDVTGARAWAVGGFPSDVFNEDGHLRSTSTASIWSVGVMGAPAVPQNVGEVPLPRRNGVSFAFLGDSACASGSCASALGLGDRGDTILLESIRQIDSAARSGRVAFLAGGGDFRRNGLPDELEPVSDLLDQLTVPVFAAMGDRDLSVGATPVSSQNGDPLGSNGYYLRAFAGFPAPFGAARPAPGFVPVTVPGQVAPQSGVARTHFAFDHAPAGRPLLRMVFLDTSRVPLAVGTQSQNPAEEQTGWLQSVLTDAQTNRIPAIVVMHQPLVLPVNTSSDASVVTGILTAGGASAVLASHQRTNKMVKSPNENVPNAIPVGIFGSGGSPLQGGDPTRGAYHAWQLVTVDTEAALGFGALAPVAMRSIPILASAALHVPKATRASAGTASIIEGLGRAPDLGGAHGQGPAADQDQGKATYIPFPFPKPCGLLEDAVRDGCRPPEVVVPDYSFFSDDPAIAEFVREDPRKPGRPYRDPNGDLVRDDQSGLLCRFRPGTASIGLRAGTTSTLRTVTVVGGSGPCIPGRFADPLDPRVVAPEGERQLVTQTTREKSTPNLLRPRLPDTAAVGALAPPIINAAPAPPSGGSGQRQEENEAASERSDMTAYREPSAGPSAAEGFATVASLIAIAFAAALVIKPRPASAARAYATTRQRRNDR